MFIVFCPRARACVSDAVCTWNRSLPAAAQRWATGPRRSGPPRPRLRSPRRQQRRQHGRLVRPSQCVQDAELQLCVPVTMASRAVSLWVLCKMSVLDTQLFHCKLSCIEATNRAYERLTSVLAQCVRGCRSVNTTALSVTFRCAQVQSDLFSPDDASNGGDAEPADEAQSDDGLSDGDEVSEIASDAGSEVRAMQLYVLAQGRLLTCSPGRHDFSTDTPSLQHNA